MVATPQNIYLSPLIQAFAPFHAVSEQLEQAAKQIGTTIVANNKSLALTALAIPQITFAIPDWLQDLMSAQKGDREAAMRLCDFVATPKGVRRDVLAQAVLRVLAHAGYDLTVYLENGDPWCDGTGTPRRLTPGEWLPHEALAWLRIEAVRAARAIQHDDTCYAPSIVLRVAPDEYNPLPLGRPLSPDIRNRRGRKQGDRRISKDDLPRRLAEAYRSAHERSMSTRGEQPYLYEIADVLGVTDRRLRDWLKEDGLKWTQIGDTNL